MKLNLPARVPNEGARRLAYYLNDKPGAFARFVRKAEVSETMAQRLINGEVIPDNDLAKAIYLATDCAVWSRHWVFRPEGGWFDRPTIRVAA
ncbi:hypothetical protein ACQR50_09160 [Sphingomonas sp. Xoc002]|uniref:hypothetical protein n=1 Tax=Sphingomonas sp. Xoc002 TaxID=2837624 RepID=UPI003D168F4B